MVIACCRPSTVLGTIRIKTVLHLKNSVCEEVGVEGGEREWEREGEGEKEERERGRGIEGEYGNR